MTRTLEDALMKTYTEVIVFCAHSVAFFRNNPNIARSRNLWSELSNDFAKVIANIRRYSRQVDETADTIRLARESHTADTIEAFKSLGLAESKKASIPCYMIPYGTNLRNFGRSSEREKLKNILRPDEKRDELSVVAIYGIGGVGKTQVALEYANTFKDQYDMVAWIPADTQIKIVQAVTRLATKLGLPNTTDGADDDYQSVTKVKDWLNTSDKTFLLVFDNVEEHQLLDQIWPSSKRGSIIMTCRSQSLASKRAWEMMHLQCFSISTGVEVLCSLTGRRPSNEYDTKAAMELLGLLGGFPLALVHVSEFMTDRSYSYEEFLPLYKKSASKIYTRAGAPLHYEHTLSTVWDNAIRSLSTESKALLNLLAFFDPDLIPEFILSNEKSEVTDPNLQFLFDEFE